MKVPFPDNCPVVEQTADGRSVGRCWHHAGEEERCPLHGDISRELAHYRKTGRLIAESRRGILKGDDDPDVDPT